MKDFTPPQGFRLVIQKPGRRTIRINRVGTFFVPMPYVLFYLHTNFCFVAFCKEDPKLNSNLYLPPLGNIYNGFEFCISQMSKNELAEVYFWSSSFAVSDWPGTRNLKKIFGKSRSKECYQLWQDSEYLDLDKIGFTGPQQTVADLFKKSNIKVNKNQYTGFSNRWLDNNSVPQLYRSESCDFYYPFWFIR